MPVCFANSSPVDRLAVRWRGSLLVCLAAVLCGCGGGQEPAQPVPAPAVSGDPQQPAQTSDQNSPTVVPTDTTPNVDSGPLASVQAMVTGLREDRPLVIWQAMPAGFRDDLEQLVHEFAGRVDPLVWQQGFEAWRKVGRLLSERSGDLATYPAWQDLEAADRDRLRRRLADLGELLELIAGSDVASVDRLKTLKIEEFLQKTGGPLLQRIGGLASSLGETSLPVFLSELEPRLLEQNDETARIGWFVKGKDQPASEFMMVRIDRAWIPAGWAESWKQVRETRQQWSRGTSPEFFTQADARLRTIADVDRLLTRLLATQSAAELHTALDREVPAKTRQHWIALIGSLADVGVEPAAELPMDPAPRNATDDDYVLVVVRGRLVPEAEDAVLTALESAVSGDSDSFPQRVDDEFHVRIGPVEDVSAFASRIRLGNVVVVDAAGRKVVIKLPE